MSLFRSFLSAVFSSLSPFPLFCSASLSSPIPIRPCQVFSIFSHPINVPAHLRSFRVGFKYHEPIPFVDFCTLVLLECYPADLSASICLPECSVSGCGWSATPPHPPSPSSTLTYSATSSAYKLPSAFDLIALAFLIAKSAGPLLSPSTCFYRSVLLRRGRTHSRSQNAKAFTCGCS